jgi:hypothetical protein
MKTRGLVLLCAIATALCVSTTKALGKTAGCPCSPCKCSPCTCGGGGSKSGGGKHHEHHGNDYSRSVGVGGTVDLSRIGHRNAEPDPFAVGGGEKSTAHTEEKRTTKLREHEPTSSTFDDIKLTGKEGKGDIPPANTFNVNNDDVKPPEAEQPKLPPSEVFTPKTPSAPSDPMDDLKKARDAHHTATDEWLKKQPNWNSLVHDWTQSPSTDEGNRKSAKAKKKIENLIDQFNAGDGKQLVDDWKETFDNALKSGASVADNSLVPPPKDDIEKKKYAVIKAKNDLDQTKQFYDWKRQDVASRDEEVKKAYDAFPTSTKDPKYKAAVADWQKAINEAGAKWAATDEGKKEAQKVHDAEKELDKAKDAWKPFEKYEEKKEASNP